MKKQVALAVAAALSLSVAGTALAAPANPFIDVPANHWSYDALAQLQKAGVISGYGDGTFRGDRNLTRYEMAAMIAKITMPGDDKNGPLIRRLQSEFATELYNLGVRVDKLEKGASTIKFTGDARIRWQMRDKREDVSAVQAGRIQERVRINMTAQVNDNINFYGRIVGVNEMNVRGNNALPATSGTGALYFDRAEFAWKNNSWGVSAGRMLPKIGQGIMAWNDRVDGVIGSYNDGKFSAIAAVFDGGTGTGNLDANVTKTPAVNITLGQLGYNFTPNIGITAMYATGHNEPYRITTPTSTTDVPGNLIKPWAVGASIGFAQDWNLSGEYIKNTADVGNADADKAGYFARLTYGTAKMSKPGSFEAYAEYLKFGVASGAAAVNASRFDMAGTAVDRKGWGVGLTYVVGKNHNMQLFYHKLDRNSDGPNKSYSGQYTVATNFVF